MNVTQRRLYMLSFVATFFLTAPVLVFLAKGYSFDRIGGVFVHNGAITIKSNPKKTDLYLDGKKISTKMLNIINNYYVINGVRFGEHTVECKKDGYTSWKKTIGVHSGISTEFWNILLFPTENTTSDTYSPKDIRQFFLSPRQDDEVVLYKETADKKSISLFTSNDRQEHTIYSTADYLELFPDTNENIEWSSNHKKLLIPANIDISLLNTKKGPASTLNDIPPSVTKDTVAVEKVIQKDYIILDLKNKESATSSLLEILNSIIFSELESSDFNIQTDDSSNNKDSTTNLTEDSVEPTKTTSPRNTTSEISTVKSLDQNNAKNTITQKKRPTLDDSNDIPISTPKIYQARWMFDSDSKLLLLTTEHQLFFIDINAPSQSFLLAEDVNGFDLAGDHVYYANLDTNSIWDIKPNRPDYKQLIFSTNFQEDTESFVKLFAYDELRIATITANGVLYTSDRLKSTDITQLNKIEENVFGVQFSDDGKKLLYWTDKNIWAYMLRKWDKQPKREKGEKIFITSLASEIKNVQWMETYENILFTNDSLVKSAEIDNRDKINLSNVLTTKSTPQNNNYLYNKDTSVLYFLDIDKDNNSTLKLKSTKLLEQIGLFGFGG